MTSPTQTCARCGALVTGKFCGQCGATTGPQQCTACSAQITAGAAYCHRCGAAVGRPAGGRSERLAWTVAAVIVVATVGAMAYLIRKGDVPAPQVAAMGNPGNAGSGGTGAPSGGGRPPDITNMTPRQRFDRLFDRIMRAASAQSADTVTMFAPMALGAYEQLDQVDTDARYHAAMIHLVVGELAQAKAKADTILISQPKHLFGFLIRGEVAEQQNDTPGLTKAYADFLAAYDGEMKAQRPEYLEHQPALEDFHNRALANQK